MVIDSTWPEWDCCTCDQPALLHDTHLSIARGYTRSCIECDGKGGGLDEISGAGMICGMCEGTGMVRNENK